MSQICSNLAHAAATESRPQSELRQSERPQSERLKIVRSTLEIAELMKQLHPSLAPALAEIEAEVKRAGQMLLDAGSIARARAALETVHRARLKLQSLDFNPPRFTA